MPLTPEQIRIAREIAMPARDTVARIIGELSEATGISESDIRSTSRKPAIVKLRQMAMTLARQEGHSLSAAAACFGVDHTTVAHAERAMGHIVGAKHAAGVR